MRTFEKFYELVQGASNEERIDEHTLTVVGWATAYVADYEEIERSRGDRQSHTLYGSCMGFGDSVNCLVPKNHESLNSMNASERVLIDVIADSGACAMVMPKHICGNVRLR